MTVASLAFHITDRCQLNCDHCLRDPGQKSLDLPVDLIRRTCAEANRIFGTDHAALTGGEPTLHPDFIGIADALVDLGYTWHFVSNGEGFARVVERLQQRPERLAALTMVNFSVDGASEEVHDAIRGAGSFHSVQQAASVCAAMGIRFRIQAAIHARNVHEIEAIALLAARLGARRVAFQMTQPTGTFLDRNLYLDPEQWRQVRARVEALQPLFTMEVELTTGFPAERPFVNCGPWLGDPLHVDVRGRLSLCCLHAGVPTADGDQENDVAGDLQHVPLADAHLRLLERIHQLRTWRSRDLAQPGAREQDRWLDMPCNWCLKVSGRPHWSDDGALGPDAARPRWRGAWQPGYKESHVEAGVRSTKPPRG